MQFMTLRYKSGGCFAKNLIEDRPMSRVFYPTRTRIELKTQLVLDIRFSGLREIHLLKARVTGLQRGRRSSGQRAGLFFEFLETESSKLNFLVSKATGVSVDSLRKHKRLPIEVPLRWGTPVSLEKHETVASDIGIGGAFIRTEEKLAPGTAVVIELKSPGSTQSNFIEAKVSWQKGGSGSGIGVEFKCRDSAGSRRLKELVRRIEST